MNFYDPDNNFFPLNVSVNQIDTEGLDQWFPTFGI